MILAVSQVQLEAVEIDACATREACTVVALLVCAGNGHLVGTPEVVTGTHPDAVRQQDVDATH